MTAFSLDATTPLEIKKENDSQLAIVWKDGHKSIYSFRDLRGACPCASCVDEKTGIRILNPASVADGIRPFGATPVGRYAIQFQWSDGHSTGIYSFDYLRALCPCASCRTNS